MKIEENLKVSMRRTASGYALRGLVALSFFGALIVDATANDLSSTKSNSTNIQKRKIYKTTYKGQVVYYHTGICCDIPSLLVDESGKLICHPNGGFVSVDKRCVDFVFDETNAIKIEGKPDYLSKKKVSD